MATEEKPLDSTHGDFATSSNQVHTTYVYVCKYEFLNELDMSIRKNCGFDDESLFCFNCLICTKLVILEQIKLLWEP